MSDHESTDPDLAGPRARFVYQNYRGEVSERTVVPGSIRFGSTEYHEKQQWLMDAFDVDKKAVRTFAMRDILRWL